MVLLGASNVTRGLPTILERLGAVETPRHLVVAAGHGRSFGYPSRVLGRTLPGILECGLWRELAGAPAGSAAVVQDVGNDLLYGVAAAELATLVSRCVERLLEASMRVALVGLPLGSLQRLSPGRFRLLRSLLFPSSRVTFEWIRAALDELQVRLDLLASRYSLLRCAPDDAWYGWDLIHVKRRCQRAAWDRILGTVLPDVLAAPRPAPAVHLRGAMFRLAPEVRWILGVKQVRAQPCWRHQSGWTLSLY